jgi:uncharacterized protein (TIGR02246 family)
MTRSIAAAATAALVLAWAGSGQAAAPGSTTADQLAIQDLMARYEWALDAGDAKGYAALFAEDGRMVFGGVNERVGRAVIQKEIESLNRSFSGAFPAGVKPRIQHILSNLVIVQHGDSAEAKSFWTEIWNPTGKAVGVRAAGHYEDKLVKRGGAWMFARREIFDDFPQTPAPARP